MSSELVSTKSLFGLPYHARLHHASDFLLVFKEGRRIGRSSALSMSACQNPSFSHARLGLIVPKKLASRAVTRNTIKRVIRESFRHHAHQLPPADYVVRLHQPIKPCSLTSLKKHLRQQVDRLWSNAIKS